MAASAWCCWPVALASAWGCRPSHYILRTFAVLSEASKLKVLGVDAK